MQLDIKLAGLDEIPLVYAVMREAFEEYRGVLTPPSGALRESVEDIVKKISSGGAVLAKLEEVAVGSAQFIQHEDHIWVGRVSVLSSHRGKGIGQQLMKFLEEYARQQGFNEMRLGVRLSLPGNITFYQKLQYEIVEKKAHPSGIDFWYLMRKGL